MHCKYRDRKLQVCSEQGVETNTPSTICHTQSSLHTGGRASNSLLHKGIIDLIYPCDFAGDTKAFTPPDPTQGEIYFINFDFANIIFCLLYIRLSFSFKSSHSLKNNFIVVLGEKDSFEQTLLCFGLTTSIISC